jgi:hypothetical protein
MENNFSINYIHIDPFAGARIVSVIRGALELSFSNQNAVVKFTFNGKAYSVSGHKVVDYLIAEAKEVK